MNISSSSLWTDKYAPTTTNEILGNKISIKKLLKVLRSNHQSNCIMVSGPAGSGKSLSVRLILKQLRYSVCEYNASDYRSKSDIYDTLQTVLSIKSFDRSRRTAVLMDEIEGMHGVSDKGGIPTLIDLMKKYDFTLICISDTPKSKNYKCFNVLHTQTNIYHIAFDRPKTSSLLKKLEHIRNNENLLLPASLLCEIIHKAHRDVRASINNMQFLAGTAKIPVTKTLDNTLDNTLRSLNLDEIALFTENIELEQTSLGEFGIYTNLTKGDLHKNTKASYRLDFVHNMVLQSTSQNKEEVHTDEFVQQVVNSTPEQTNETTTLNKTKKRKHNDKTFKKEKPFHKDSVKKLITSHNLRMGAGVCEKLAMFVEDNKQKLFTDISQSSNTGEIECVKVYIAKYFKSGRNLKDSQNYLSYILSELVSDAVAMAKSDRRLTVLERDITLSIRIATKWLFK